MRERSQTMPRRRGPKLHLPAPRRYNYEENFFSESPYYTIDNTENIYGTTLSPTQRCYVDPWDLENYDYVRKKLSSTPIRCSAESYYDTSLSTSPYYMARSPSSEVPLVSPKRLAATMPRTRRQSQWNNSCQLGCCSEVSPMSTMRRRRYKDTKSEINGVDYSKYDDYMSHMIMNIETDEDKYTDYDGLSSSSSTELHSSIDEELYKAPTFTINRSSGYESTIRRKTGSSLYDKPAPRLEFPAPQSIPPPTPSYDYSNPYATSPHCSASDCYVCSMFYASPSMYGVMDSSAEEGYNDSAIYCSSTERSPFSSLYSGIYSNKFVLSKTGLLQIDYSCSWNDLDRIMGRQY
ncbi:uncharacterized protein [Eurosta solidaginis]|uniref:uncharacterized protein n=1 Tax=Eurosta solidaginis TaxID=178769 RepID=UPI003531555B